MRTLELTGSKHFYGYYFYAMSIVTAKELYQVTKADLNQLDFKNP